MRPDAPLSGSEVLSDTIPIGPQGATDDRPIGLGDRRQEFPQDETAQPVGKGGRHGRQLSEGLALRCTGQPSLVARHPQQHPPRRRELRPGDERSQPVDRRLPPIHQESALLEPMHADRRSHPAPDTQGQLRRGDHRRAGNRLGHGERQLRAAPQSKVPRRGAADFDGERLAPPAAGLAA